MTSIVSNIALLCALLTALIGCSTAASETWSTSTHEMAASASPMAPNSIDISEATSESRSPSTHEMASSASPIASHSIDMSEPWAPPVNPHIFAGPIFDQRSAEDLTLHSDHIARVRLLDVEEGMRTPGVSKRYAIEMIFKFQVLEWLKGGNGEGEIKGGIGMEHAEGDTLEEARWKAKYYFDSRDSQYDSRETIVFFQRVPLDESNIYSIGWIGDSLSPWPSFLPLASAGGASGASGEQRFIWSTHRPLPPESSGASGASDEWTISLTTLRRLSGMTNAELKRRERSVIGYAEVNSSPPPETDLGYLAARSKTRGRDNWIELVWSKSEVAERGVSGYRILRRKQTDSEFIELANISADTSSHYEDMRDIQPETKYIYRLRAYGASGDIADARIAITTVAALEPLSGAAATATTPTASPTPPQPTATVVPTATPTNTPATAPTATNTPATAPTLTPTPPTGGVSGAIDTPTPTATSMPPATATHTPTIAPTATLESSSGGVTGQ